MIFLLVYNFFLFQDLYYGFQKQANSFNFLNPSRLVYFLKVVLEKKLSEIFIFSLLSGVSKGFMKVFKAFLKPFEARQRSVKIKM